MTLALAQREAGDLRVALLDNGVRQVSLELQQGVAGSGWAGGQFRRGLGHHIVSRRSSGLTPGLALVKRGRPDLGGPLCNGYGGFDLIARIITMGWANHPGAGGPWSVPGWGTIPRNNGRPYIFGWEFEGGLNEADWTDEFHEFMARCGAGTLDWLGGAPLECWDEHKGWAPARKIDRLHYTTASGRQRIAAVRGTRPPLEEDDDMPLNMPITVPPAQAAWPISFGPSGGTVGGKFVPGGAARHGQMWAAFLVDCGDAPREPMRVRIGVQGGDGNWRPAFGKDYWTTLRPGAPRLLTLAAGDQGLVISTPEKYAVGVRLETAKAA